MNATLPVVEQQTSFSMSSLRILSGGAAQGLVQQLRGHFYNETGRAIEGSFGAEGAIFGDDGTASIDGVLV